jgi:transcriptional regulator with XRE-family HTH domain
MKMDFKKLIRAELERQGLSQNELVRRTGITKSRVSNFLNGKRDIQGKNLRKMFMALDIEVKPADKPEKEKR